MNTTTRKTLTTLALIGGPLGAALQPFMPEAPKQLKARLIKTGGVALDPVVADELAYPSI